jgi:cytochrome c5
VSQQDQNFMRTFTIVLAVLAVMGVAFYFIAQNVSGKSAGSTSKMAEKATLDRIAPVGQVNVGEAKAAGASAGRSGKDVVMASCGGCHNAGVLGAPKIGNKADWEPRMANGLDAIVKSAISGKGAMPPRGGGNFSDDEIKAAIQYMLKESSL